VLCVEVLRWAVKLDSWCHRSISRVCLSTHRNVTAYHLYANRAVVIIARVYFYVDPISSVAKIAVASKIAVIMYIHRCSSALSSDSRDLARSIGNRPNNYFPLIDSALYNHILRVQYIYIIIIYFYKYRTIRGRRYSRPDSRTE